MSRKRDEAFGKQVPCWGEACRRLSHRSTKVRFTPTLTVAVCLCEEHEELLKQYVGVPIFERLPAPVAEDHVAA